MVAIMKKQMKHGAWLMGILLSCMTLSACANNAPAKVWVSQQNNGESLTLYQGQDLIVELRQRTSSPYAWRVTADGTAVFYPFAKQVIQFENQSTVVERYIFTVARGGHSQIQIDELPVDLSNRIPQRTFVLNVVSVP